MATNNMAVSRRRILQAAGAAGALGVIVTQSAAAQQRNPLDRHIVGTEPGQAAVARNAASEVYRVLDFGDIGQAVSGWYTEEALEGLANNPNVRYIEAEGVMEAIGHTIDEDAGDPTQDQVLPWGIDRVDADVAHHNGETGAGSSVAIIDTGIEPTHQDLEVAGGRNFVDCDNEDDSAACADDWEDGHGHGTHCSGTADALDNSVGVIGTSVEAALYAVRVLDDDGSGTFSDVAAGIAWTADQGIHVGSLSLGGGDSQTVEDACVYAYGLGTLLVAAAGNDGNHPVFSTVNYPAAYEEVMAISATDQNDDIAGFSSRGSEIELAAPGVDVLSSLPGDDYDRWSGTSMACPHVSGAGVQLMANGSSNMQARETLNTTAEDLGLSSDEQGNGLVDVAAALDLDSDDGDTNSSPTCSLVNPNDGDTVSGTVTIQVDASDTEDDDTTLDVDISIDGGAWLDTAYNSDSGYYEYDWDTTAEDDDDHTIRARATDSDGATTESEQITVTVDNSGGSEGSAPTIDRFDLTERNNPRWAWVQIDWAVSDSDGNLDTVTSELRLSGSSEVLDAETSSVSGANAEGQHELRNRDGHGETYDVTLTVTDTTGNSTAETKQIPL